MFLIEKKKDDEDPRIKINNNNVLNNREEMKEYTYTMFSEEGDERVKGRQPTTTGVPCSK